MSEKKQPEKKGGGKKTLLVVFILILLGLNGVMLWLHYDTEKKHEVAIAEKNTEIDTLKVEAAQLLEDLEAAKAQAEQLGLDTAELGAQIIELEKLNKTLQRTKNAGYAQARKYKAQLAGYKELLLKKDKEIAMKDSTIKVQQGNIDQLETEKGDLNTQVTSLTDERDDLQGQVDIASILRAENVVVTMLNSKGKEYSKQPFKAKKIDKIKIVFNLGNNAVAETGTKPIAIRIVEPSGSALYDIASGGGSFMANGKEVFYSAKQGIMFANKKEVVNFMYVKGSEYKSGLHKVEIYEGENIIGEGSFNVK